VAEAAVFALADEEWGELCVAAVVRRRAASGAVLQAPQLLEHCRLFLAGYKLPRRLKFVDDLPRSGSGKIQKRILRERFLLMAPNEFDASELRR
jgi:fatty-acyl-CoA synthase